MAKAIDDADTLLETMSSNNYQWHLDRAVVVKAVGVQGNDMFPTLFAQIAASTTEGAKVFNAYLRQQDILELLGSQGGGSLDFSDARGSSRRIKGGFLHLTDVLMTME
ncbi:uncharacterized protein G2W53_004600 [Senna tora]|uniref:Uncharacterized protein n=1 Tax=Senna tora TaxID=362788 RepID=A0A834XDN1_9FABA|nr:uncharacterized protein G2W53_004600 [Senna tora]